MKIDGNVLKELRKQNGLTLASVAARLQVSEATVSRYESGEIQRASPRVLKEYSTLFRVPIKYICEDTDPDWVEALQTASLCDPRVSGFIQYLEEQAEKEMNDFQLSKTEMEIVESYRSADEKTQNLVLYALGIGDRGKEGDR